MFRNYFKIAFRNLYKRKVYTMLNILGLTIGMTSCLLIFHYVSYEKSYDNHITNSENKYRLRLDHYLNGEAEWKSATIYPGIGPAIKRDFPEVESFCRLIDANVLLLNEENQTKFKENAGYFAEQNTISMFDLEFKSGNPKTALVGPNKMIVSEQFAKKYFGTTNALGKYLTVIRPRKNYNYEITGVYNDYPKNAHLAMEFLISFDTYKAQMRRPTDSTDVIETLFDFYDFYTYLKFKSGTDVVKFENKLPGFCNKYTYHDDINKTYDELHVIPLKDIHLNSNYNQEAEVNGNGQKVAFVFLIGIFIICIAWINYVNLSTARSVERAKEVGLKKVVGAMRSDLVKQFLIENTVLNVISLLFSLLVFSLLFNSFDVFTGKDFITHTTLTSYYWILFLAIFIFGTIFSGLYPAFVLSGFQPIKVLKGSFKTTSSGIILRKGLIIIQFVISVVLISGTIIVYQQVSFMRSKNIGANINQTIALSGVSTMRDSVFQSILEPFKTELLQQSFIKNISGSNSVIGQEIYWVDDTYRFGDKTHISTYGLGIDYDFVSLYDLKIVAGRNFSKDYISDKKGGVLINEKAAKMLGFAKSEDAVNKKIISSSVDTATIIGVLADYHQQGLQKTIDPMILPLFPNSKNYFSIKSDIDLTPEKIQIIENIWKKYFPNDPFNYFFLDEKYNQQYKQDVVFGKVFAVFSLLAILIACFGLLGLSSYNVLQRSKEIGIRKVLGASITNIITLLLKDFFLQIIIAFIIAMPLGWYVMNLWLQDFAYRIDISWLTFLFAGVLSLLIAVLTILIHAYKSAIANPIKSLRTE